MGPLLRAELLKLRTTRTFVAFALIAVGLSLLLAILLASLSEPSEDTVLDEVYASDLSSFFILILGVIGVAGEWRHRTITSSLLAAPDRLRFLLAKAVAYAIAGAALSLLISATVAAVASVILTSRGLPLPGAGELLGLIGRGLVIAALLGALGAGIGALVRNQPIAIVGLLVVGFVVEPTLLALAPDVGRFGPVVAAPTAIADPDDLEELLAPGFALLVSLAWVALTVGLGTVLLRRRDLDGG